VLEHSLASAGDKAMGAARTGRFIELEGGSGRGDQWSK